MPVAHIRTTFKRLASFDANAFVYFHFFEISNCMFAIETSRPGPSQAESQLIVFWRKFFFRYFFFPVLGILFRQMSSNEAIEVDYSHRSRPTFRCDNWPRVGLFYGISQNFISSEPVTHFYAYNSVPICGTTVYKSAILLLRLFAWSLCVVNEK